MHLRPNRFYPCIFDYVEHHQQNFLTLFFFARSFSDSIKLSQEHDEFKWFSLSEIQQGIVEGYVYGNLELYGKVFLQEYYLEASNV